MIGMWQGAGMTQGAFAMKRLQATSRQALGQALGQALAQALGQASGQASGQLSGQADGDGATKPSSKSGYGYDGEQSETVLK